MPSGLTTSRQSETTNQTQNQRPLAEQMPFLMDAWRTASNTFQNRPDAYSGPMLAGLTPEQLGTFRDMYNFAGSSGAPAYSQNTATGAAGTAGQLGAAGAGMLSSGQAIGDRGAAGLLSTAGRLGSFSPTGGVGSNIDAAGRYADNPYLSGQVDATMRDARRQVSEQALPQVARNAAMTGNIGSSKRGIAEGILERGLAEKTADVSAGLRGDAYARGLALSEQGRQFDNSAMMDALKSSGALYGAGANVGTARTAAGTDLSRAALSASSLGLDANNQALAQQVGLLGLANQAGAGMQAGNQLDIDNARAMSEYGLGQDWDNLARYYSIVGSNNWGGTRQTNGTTTTESTPSPMNTLAGIGGSLTGLFGSGGFNMLAPMGQLAMNGFNPLAGAFSFGR